jgi:ribosome maturation factor RimP
MKKSLLNHVRPLIVCIVGLCIMVFFAACSGVATTTTNANGTQTVNLQGKLLSINGQSATFLYNGQQVTVNNLSPDQIALLQPQVGKTVTIQVTQTGATTYNVNVNTNVQVDGTPVTTTNTTTTTTTNNGQPTTTTTVAQGKLDFVGKVQSINANSITVTMPNGDALTMAINNLTDREDFNGGLPTQGQQIKVEGYTNPDGSLTAKKFGILKADDQANTIKLNTVDFQGVTSSGVASDNVLHFNVGTKSYSYAMNSTTQMKDFVNSQAIQANQIVKVEVLFNGQNGTVTKVENGND